MSSGLSTLQQACSVTQEIRKSRFIANAAPIGNPTEALQWLETTSDRQATHNCWAYRIGQAYRFSDDGEPGGTAGKPILQAIDGQALDRVIVVVTRWYGGIKLGAGGLIRAYGGCAAECLRLAPRVALVDLAEVDCPVSFAALAAFKSRLFIFEAQVLAEDFDATGAVLRLSLPRAQLDSLGKWLADLSRGQSELHVRD